MNNKDTPIPQGIRGVLNLSPRNLGQRQILHYNNTSYKSIINKFLLNEHMEE